MATINQQQILLELKSAEPIIKAAAEDFIRREYFIPAVREMQQDFERHVVTQELDAASDDVLGTDNRSETLGGMSYGNLYSFIGFSQGTKPTNAIRNRLVESSAAGPKLYSLPVKKRGLQYEFEILGPDLDVIYEATPLPWAPGFSWAERLEKGIEGLGRFLSKDKYGRSGGGYQSKNDVRPGSKKSTPIEYLSGIVRKFIDRIT